MAKSVNIVAELDERESDVSIPALLYPKIPPFSELPSAAKLFNFPGAVILRRFRKGEVICRQGDPGWTAFYIPTTEELTEIRNSPKKQLVEAAAELRKNKEKVADLEKQRADATDPKKAASLDDKISEAREQAEEIRKKMEELQGAAMYLELDIRVEPPSEGSRKVASVQLTSASVPIKKRRKGLIERITGAISSPSPSGSGPKRRSISIDAPLELDSKTREGALNEGELFGEMSCLYRAPRSATVIATRNCFMLEMLRSVLDVMMRDAKFKAKLDQIYRDRVLGLQLRSIPILSSLSPELLEEVRQKVELMDFPSGGVLYDEGDRSDGMHLIRSGIVKVMRNASYLIKVEDVVDWAALQTELIEASVPSSGPRQRVWSLLPLPLREWLPTSKPEDLTAERKIEIVDALNGLIRNSDLDRAADLFAEARAGRVARKIWQRLASPPKSSEQEMQRCQRLLIESLFGSKLPEWKQEDDTDPTYLFQPEEFRDWKASAAALVEASTAKEGEPKRRLWDLLSPAAQAALKPPPKPEEKVAAEVKVAVEAKVEKEPAADKAPAAAEAKVVKKVSPLAKRAADAKAERELSADEKTAVIEALNAIVRGRPLLLYPEFQTFVQSKKPARLVMEFLPSGQAWRDYDYQRLARGYNRLLLDVVFPKGLGTSRRPEGPPQVLAYRSRGEAIGEMALLEGKPRAATCVAYGHPEDDPERTVGPIQLVKVSQEVFDYLKEKSPDFLKQVEQLVASRKAETVRRSGTAPKARPTGPALPLTHRAEDLGLLQGQKLMLIDLDRCTRCDECVQACVNTHDDGRSRLFLDGPRYGRYLVPSTCRSCHDPVCMIGCPVGSIHRGGNGEIIIEDWCIGCGLCSSQCPYGSIQMHTIGIIPGSAPGWYYAPFSAVPPGWFKTGRFGKEWLSGTAPFVFDREFLSTLPSDADPAGPIAFRYEFEVSEDLLAPDRQFVVSMNSMDEGAALWLNGLPLLPVPVEGNGKLETEKKESRDEGWWEFEVTFPTGYLRRGKNLVAVRITPVGSGKSNRLLDLRLDREQGASTKLVEQKAVVCDLCSAQFGQRPACVTACPHDAAIRVDALNQFSMLP
jgi:Fe-S-cluster-containing dehydrogenase component/CRP-like cAMP-binding protein